MTSAALAHSTLLAAGASHTGLQRENNEDRFHCDPSRGIFMVVDGVGGHAAGEKAAETALTMIRARLERETGRPADRVREAIALANNGIVRLGASEPAWTGMACVLTVALVREGRATIGHVGDTRLYVLDDAGLVKVTHDHSPIGEREDQGEIDEHEAMSHPRRNEIYRDVGSAPHEPGDEEFIELIEMPLARDAALLLCSDGLSDMVASGPITRILLEHGGDPAAAVERLIEAANQAGGKDNVTAVTVMGPGFAEVAGRRLLARSRKARFGLAAAARRAGEILTSRPALLVYGLIAGLGLAAALLFFSGLVADRLVDVARPPGWSRTWVVGAGDAPDFATIAEALARAQPGDVVEVEPGTYDLPLVVPRGVSLVSRRWHEAILRTAAGAQPHSPAVHLVGGSRFAGFKLEAAGGAAVSVGDEGDDESALEDLEVVGASGPAVIFGRGSRGVLRSSYIHDNSQVAVLVLAAGRPSLLHNVITANGKRAAGSAQAADGDPRTGPVPAIVLQDGASATFFGNVIAGNADDQVTGLAPDKKADVLRDNVVGLTPPARPSTAAKPRSGTSRQP